MGRRALVTASSGGTDAVVAFLASPLAGYVNGVGLRVDGGITPYPP